MAKQTFSVGQVLTAAQMTSLQQTAMLGGSATAKTASYTLVAADAGTVVSVNSTSATTITVNTGLFSAGDTVTIQNWGSGAVTITAGTATVNTAGSLIVPQYDGGVLYFTSASAAIYFDWVQAGATSPLTTKGDIWGYGTSDARIPIGTNGHVLTADSTQTLGLKWAAVSSGAFTKISRTSFSNVAGQDFNDVFSSTYPTYRIVIENIFAASANDVIQFQVKTSGGVQSASYYGSNLNLIFSSTAIDTVVTNNNGTVYKLNKDSAGSDAAAGSTFVFDVINAGINGRASWSGFGNVRQSGYTNAFGGYRAATETVTGFRLSGSTSNITGTVAIYGYGA